MKLPLPLKKLTKGLAKMSVKLSKKDIDKVSNRYVDRLKEYGYSQKTLGWNKGRQELRFQVLTESFDLNNSSLLDIGCGFGDLLFFAEKKCTIKSYLGIDLVDELLEKARSLHNGENVKFISGDFLAMNLKEKQDYVVGSGLFNFQLEDGGNWDFIQSTLNQSFNLCEQAIAFNFLSDKVDFKDPLNYHTSPEKILSFAYSLSKNLIIRNDYMPFEFTLIVFKDDKWNNKKSIFNRVLKN